MRTSEISAPPGTQPSGVSISTRDIPSDISTIRTTAPSTLPGETLTRRTVGAIDPTSKRIILQPTRDVNDLIRLAQAEQSSIEGALRVLETEVPGTQFIASRIKGASRIQEKIGTGRNADTISDYLAARISFRNQDDLPAILQSLERQGLEPANVDNFLNNPRIGYRAVHINVKGRTGLSVEIQLVPEEIAAVQEEAHFLFEVFRKAEVSTAEREAVAARSEAIFGEAFARFQERQGRSAVLLLIAQLHLVCPLA